MEILKGIKPATFAQFKMNPEEFIIKTANIINDAKAIAVIQKIAYERSTNTYDMDIFTESTIRGKLGINALESAKSLYDIVVVDSLGVEKNFAEALEKRMQWKYIPNCHVDSISIHLWDIIIRTGLLHLRKAV